MGNFDKQAKLLLTEWLIYLKNNFLLNFIFYEFIISFLKNGPILEKIQHIWISARFGKSYKTAFRKRLKNEAKFAG